MKERPILMTPENAQKCHEGTKTQTRRIVKPQPPYGCEYCINGAMSHALCRSIENHNIWVPPTGKSVDHRLACPYGQVGDRLWVREAWQEKAWTLTQLNSAGLLNAPMKPKETYLNEPIYAIHRGGYNYKIGDPGRWFPSIHMPRWACRTVVEITEIRAERLQDISEEDARAEGSADRERTVEIGEDTDRKPCLGCGQRKVQHVGSVKVCFGSHGEVFNRHSLKGGYSWLWEFINGKGSWERNDWVWVLCFKKV